MRCGKEGGKEWREGGAGRMCRKEGGKEEYEGLCSCQSYLNYAV